MRSEEEISADVLFEQAQIQSEKDFLGSYFRWRGETFHSRAGVDAAIRQAVARDSYVRNAARPNAAVQQSPVVIPTEPQSPFVIVALKIIAWMNLIGSLFWLFVLENKVVAINLIVLSIVGFIMLYAFATVVEILWDIRALLSGNLAAAGRQNRVEGQ
ncbi:MAG TPA: hypothetical protein VGG10_07975 [Rhizomicrobium sp.]|jgi:hypothetical protein